MPPVDLDQELRILAEDIEEAFATDEDTEGQPFKAAYCQRLAREWAARLRGIAAAGKAPRGG
jgi:hypothetical protein